MIKDGTPIKLKLKRGVYSQYAKDGDKVEYLVDEEVLAGEKIVVPEGTVVEGKVITAEHKRRMGRGGKIDISAESIKLFNSQNIPLRALQHARGGGQGLNMTGGMLAAAAFTLGVGAPFALLMHGKDVEIRQGSDFTAFVDGDIWLEDIAFPTKNASPEPAAHAKMPALSKSGPEPASNSRQVALSISSSPGGAEIELDGNFVGNTPESINVSSGDHLLIIRKHGYKAWERRLRATGELVNVIAELDSDSQ